jgi:YVTN family beta-propeller protein
LTIKLNSFISIIFTIGIALFFAGISQNLHSVWGDTVVETIPVGQGPIALEFNPENDNMYVADFNSGNVSVIDSSSNTIGETIPVGQGPVALEFNPENDNMYVANEKSGDVSVIETE